MKKRSLSLLICLVLVVSMLAACGKKEETTETPSTSTAVENQTENTAPTAEPTKAPVVVVEDTESTAVAAEELPTPVYYYSFDAKDGTDGIAPAIQDKTATPIVSTNNDKEVVFIPGVKGDAVYTNGAYGYKLPEVNGVGDTYTVSFWLYATRFATYMPTVQFGPDIHGDLTGSQHYLNITRAAWSSDGSFPCIWSYDQADNAKWPYWDSSEANDRLKAWHNIVLVVDADNKSVDGEYILADMYLDGELFADDAQICFGTMAPSENFDFLLGINYWDAIFKGAFDELYIFDKALTAGQVATLYADGDASVPFEEPERIITVTPDEKAIASLGTTDYKLPFWSQFSDVYEIKDGETKQIKLHNWSDGINAWDNYVIGFNDTAEIPATMDELAYGLLRADAYGFGAFDAATTAYTYTWGNWNTWASSAMVDAVVTVDITRNGNQLFVSADAVDFNSTSNLMTATATVENLTADAPMYFVVSGENAYIDVLSFKDRTVTANAGVTVGLPDCTTPWWTSFSPIWAVPAGETRTVGFTNYTDGVNNWDNFVAILQNTPVGHGADQADGYMEYAVVRADNYGWGDGYVADLNVCDWDWDSFASDMDGAHVALSVTNNGDTAVVDATVTTVTGTQRHQQYTVNVSGDLYFCLGCEAAYLVLDSNVIGSTDCSTPWWTTFSDIWYVPEGGSKSVSFRNYTDGVNNWDNFVAILQNTPYGHNAEAAEGYMEYAVVRADNYGWGDGYATAALDCNWNWDTFASDMDGAYVDLTVKNNGATADVLAHITTMDGAEYFQNYTGITTGGDLYFCLSGEGSYLVIDANQNGFSENNTPWWNRFSPITAVAEGETKSVSFTNYTDGVNNWDNFVVILQTTPTGHGAEVEGYAEYAVVRADNYGWGDGYTTATLDCNWDWDTFAEDMYGANVTVLVTNNGATADVDCYITTAAGKTYFQKYDGITTGGDLYFCLGCEASHQVMD